MVPPIDVEMNPGPGVKNPVEAIMAYSPTRPVPESPAPSLVSAAESPLKEDATFVNAVGQAASSVEEGDPSNYYFCGEEGPNKLRKQSVIAKLNEQLSAQGYDQKEK